MTKSMLNLVTDGKTVTTLDEGALFLATINPSTVPDDAVITWASLKTLLGLPITTAADGWISDTNTWTYSSADAPTFILSINADMTARINTGDRIKLTQTTDKYFIVTSVGAYSGGNTLITVYGGVNYTLISATITSPKYSHAKSPFGFPSNPANWTVTYLDGSMASIVGPVQNTWYNAGGLAFSMPIGVWNVNYKFSGVVEGNASAASIGFRINISTTNGGESNAAYTSAFLSTGFAVGSSPARRDALTKSFLIARTTKATYYINIMTDTVNAGAIRVRGDFSTTVVDMVCAYL